MFRLRRGAPALNMTARLDVFRLNLPQTVRDSPILVQPIPLKIATNHFFVRSQNPLSTKHTKSTKGSKKERGRHSLLQFSCFSRLQPSPGLRNPDFGQKSSENRHFSTKIAKMRKARAPKKGGGARRPLSASISCFSCISWLKRLSSLRFPFSPFSPAVPPPRFHRAFILINFLFFLLPSAVRRAYSRQQ